MFGENAEKTRYRIYQGKIVTGKGEAMRCGDYIGGFLRGIYRREADSTTKFDENGKPKTIQIYDLEFVDGKDRFVLSLVRNNGVTRDIIRTLYAVPEFSTSFIRIDVYTSENRSNPSSPFTNAKVRINNEKIRWADLPKPVKVTTVNGEIYDYSQIYDVLDHYVAAISGRIIQERNLDNPAAPASAPSYIPSATGEEDFYDNNNVEY